MKNDQRYGVFLLCVGALLSLAVGGIEGAENIKMTDAEPGIYCRLTTAEMRDRLDAIRAEFLVHVKGVDELENGYRYWFEKTPERIQLVTDFIDFESRCCAFFQFDLSVAPGAERVSLSLTGRTGTKDFVESMMKSAAFDWRAAALKP